MAATNIASLSVLVGADIRPLTDGLKAASASIGQFAKSAPSAAKSGLVSYFKGILTSIGSALKWYWDKLSASLYSGSMLKSILMVGGDVPLVGFLFEIAAGLWIVFDALKAIFKSLPVALEKTFGFLFKAIKTIVALPLDLAVGLEQLYHNVGKFFLLAVVSIPKAMKFLVSGIISGIAIIPKILKASIGLVFDLGKALATGLLSAVKGIYSILTSDAVKNALSAAAIGVTGIGIGMAVLAKQGMDFIVSTTTMADKIGLSVEAMTQLGYAAKSANVDIEDIATDIKMMLKNVSLAASGAGPAKNIMGELGINPVALASMKPEQMLLTLADAISIVGNAADRTRIAMAVFGRSGQQMIPIISQGSAGLMAMAEESDKVVGSFSRIDAQQIMQANNAIGRMLQSFLRVKIVLATAVAPFIEYAANAIVQFGQQGFESNGLIQKGLEVTAKIFAWILDTTQVFIEKIKTIPDMVSAMADSFSQFGKVVWAAIGWLIPKGKAALGYMGGKTKDFFSSIFGETRILDQNKWSTRVTKFFQDIKDNSRNTATEFVNNMNPMNEAVSMYSQYLEEAKRRAEALADALKQKFHQGPIQTIAINTALNRAMYNQQLRAGRLEKMEVGGRDLEMIGRGIYDLNRKWDAGIALKAT